MAMFDQVAKAQLMVLLWVLLLGNPFRVIPANTAEACGADLYVRVVLVLASFTAAMIILQVRAWVRIAQATTARAKAFDADDHQVVREGIGSVAATWERRSLRGELLLAVVLSFGASVLAVVAFEDGFRYRAGCDSAYDAGYYGASSPMRLLMIGLFALVHGFFAWVAVSQN